MPKNIKILATLLVCLILIIQGATAADDTFKESITGSSGGLSIGEGVFPFSLSWSKNKDISLLDEDEFDKAHLVFSFSSSVTRDRDYGYDLKTGSPSWDKQDASS